MRHDDTGHNLLLVYIQPWETALLAAMRHTFQINISSPKKEQSA